MSLKVIELASFSLDEVCRVCLMSAETDMTKVESDDGKLSYLFEQCTSLKVDESDESWKICDECTEDLLKFYKFRLKSLSTHQILLQIAESKMKAALEENCTTMEAVVDEDYSGQLKSEDDYIEANMPSTSRRIKRQYYCAPCNVIFGSLEELQQHRKEAGHVHAQSKARRPYCASCTTSFASIKELRVHRMETGHVTMRTSKCPHCEKVFDTSHIAQHMRTHTNEKPFVCDVCNKAFSIKFNLERHRMLHTGEKPYQCNRCDKAFIQSKALQEHMRLHTGETPYKCELCEKRFRVQVSYKVHMMKHNQGHKPKDRPKTKHECPICHKLYSTKMVLKTHMITHGERNSYLCSDCGKSFLYKSGYKVHLKLHEGMRSHICSVCGKRFTQAGSLRRHELIHRGEKPYVCEICNAAFNQKTHLRYHIEQIHIRDKPYECTYCGKRFTLKGTLTVHNRTHTGETPYKCTLCGRGFYDCSSMKKHIKRRHEAPHPIDEYPEEFSTDIK